MKVLYHKTIMDQINDARVDAMRDNKRINKILLTASEVEQLHNEFPWDEQTSGIQLGKPGLTTFKDIVAKGNMTIFGIKLGATPL